METAQLEEVEPVMMFDPLLPKDRCDAHTAAQALVRVVKDSQDLIFCSHCYNSLELTLTAAGWSLETDLRDTLK